MNEVCCSVTFDGNYVDMEIYDPPGQNDFSDAQTRLIQQCDGFFLVFRVDNKESFEYLQEVYNEIVRVKGPKTPVVIVGNYCDLPQPHVVPYQYAQEQSARLFNNAPVYGVCHSNPNTIIQAYETLARRVFKKHHKDESSSSSSSSSSSKKKKKPQQPEAGCCRIV